MPSRLCRQLTHSIAAVAVAIALVAGCEADNRPNLSDWTEQWNEAQLLVPTERELANSGRTYCDQLLGELRTELHDLTPAPSEWIDPTLDAWSDHLRTLAFECPSDPTTISDALATIRSLAAQIRTAIQLPTTPTTSEPIRSPDTA